MAELTSDNPRDVAEEGGLDDEVQVARLGTGVRGWTVRAERRSRLLAGPSSRDDATTA